MLLTGLYDGVFGELERESLLEGIFEESLVVLVWGGRAWMEGVGESGLGVCEFVKHVGINLIAFIVKLIAECNSDAFND